MHQAFQITFNFITMQLTETKLKQVIWQYNGLESFKPLQVSPAAVTKPGKANAK